jgi:hypothetical protein
MKTMHKKKDDSFYTETHTLSYYKCTVCDKIVLSDGKHDRIVSGLIGNLLFKLFYGNRRKKLDMARHLYHLTHDQNKMYEDNLSRRINKDENDKDVFYETGLTLEEIIKREGQIYADQLIDWCVDNDLGNGSYCPRTGGSYRPIQTSPLRFEYVSGRRYHRALAQQLGATVIVDNMEKDEVKQGEK